ncbi:MAG: fructose-bisphosphate aldolase [Candidatus Wolframiiraptor sp. EX4484-121]|nr:MAG: fructose-bisphosphate aldolase [Candidatus Wolframiiraptor sp. EX4484-121]
MVVEDAMSMAGKNIRLSRIFNPKTGNAFVVTMDHGVDLGPLKGIEDLSETLNKLFAGERKPDAILMNPSMIRRYYDILAKNGVGIIARIDGTATTIAPNWYEYISDYRLFSSVEEALMVGADAVATMAFYGCPRESQNNEKIGKISQECIKWGMPHIVEALPPEIVEHHFKAKAKWRWPDPKHVSFVDRSAAELGADVVKSYYTGDPDTFKEVVKCCPVPIIVLSGPGAEDPKGLLEIVKGAMDGGARGVIMGRNIWGYKEPTKIVQAVAAIVHEKATVEEALKLLK